jgi:large subunit ribosomal protein L25
MQLKLNATKRERLGKHARRVQKTGKLPAVVYGHHSDTTALLLDGHEFQRVFSRAGRSHLVDLVVDGSAPEKVLVREIQTHPRRMGPIHVDLYQVSMQEKLHADIPVHLTGESPIVKQGEADLLHAMHQIKVECLPGDIPEHIDVDVSELMMHQGIRVRDLQGDAKWKPISDPDMMIVHVVTVRAEEPAPAEAAAAAAAAPGSGPAVPAAATPNAASPRQSPSGSAPPRSRRRTARGRRRPSGRGARSGRSRCRRGAAPGGSRP